jgi:hypothetical protein
VDGYRGIVLELLSRLLNAPSSEELSEIHQVMTIVVKNE